MLKNNIWVEVGIIAVTAVTTSVINWFAFSPKQETPKKETNNDIIDEAQYEKGYKNYYQILEVDPDASDKKIREAFIKMYLTKIPEKEKKNEISADEGVIMSYRVVEAYGVLSDPDERGKYDWWVYARCSRFFRPNFDIENEEDREKIVDRYKEWDDRENEWYKTVDKELKELVESKREELKKSNEELEKLKKGERTNY